MTAVAAILLAAGQSKRMGAFKPLLPFGAKTVIESCIGYLQRGGVESILEHVEIESAESTLPALAQSIVTAWQRKRPALGANRTATTPVSDRRAGAIE